MFFIVFLIEFTIFTICIDRLYTKISRNLIRQKFSYLLKWSFKKSLIENSFAAIQKIHK